MQEISDVTPFFNLNIFISTWFICTFFSSVTVMDYSYIYSAII